jgi:hypothetical protein
LILDGLLPLGQGESALYADLGRPSAAKVL